MSDAKTGTQNSAASGDAGRMLSRARRQAMSRGGKNGVGQVPRVKPETRSVMSARVESVAPVSQADASAADCGCTHTDEAQTLEAVCTLIETEGSGTPSVRQLCQERRRTLSSQGNASNSRNGLTGRAAAQTRREELCLNGRGDSPACRPSGQVRGSAGAPAKVEKGSTLRGNLVTGTQVERSSKVTGIESGSCRAITGTEYIGAEQYGELCATTPVPAAKVGCGSTSRGQRVSGSEVGRSSKVTGDEPGACLKLTGNQYVQPDPSGNVCQGSGVPHKVSVMSTLRERPVTGTDVSAGTVVTGSEYGACKNVTGTEYAGLQQYQACNRTPVLMPEKVSVLRTWRDQAVSGTSVEHNPKVTGDEYGGCQPISGTEYIGPGQYAEFCASDRLAASRERVATARGAAGASMTGVRQGVEHKVTGSARGNVQHLSGTPYSDDAQSVLSGAAGMNQHYLTRGPADQSRVGVATVTTPAQRNFSVLSPARTAQENQLNRVTGTAYGAQGRITGPVNLAAGLVSGTPEFRYREDSCTAAPVAKEPAQEKTPTNRVTGEGRESGFAITGAAWQRGGSTTGTEGSSATRRNPTLRGDKRSMGMQVPAVKDREHLQVPPSKITGSSGNAATGSTITYSGGARG